MSNIKNMSQRYDFDIDMRQLRYFVAVAEELHFGRAAAKLGMAQPPLTQQIQKLERALGCPVFFRQPRKTTLTAAGVALLEDARRILRDFEEARERARRAGRGETGQLTVGTPPSVMLTRLPAAIRKYRERFPEIRFTLRELATSAIAAGLEAGTVDLGLLREASSGEVMLREPVVAVLPAGHAFAASEALKLRQLAEEPFVLFPRRLGEAFYDRLISFCVHAGFTPRVVQEATQWQSVVTFVETGLGVSLAPACVQRFRWKGVVYRELPGLHTTVSAGLGKEGASPAAAAFLNILRGEFRKGQG
jgi:DNA-binding transcriptional LysR family regulator